MGKHKKHIYTLHEREGKYRKDGKTQDNTVRDIQTQIAHETGRKGRTGGAIYTNTKTQGGGDLTYKRKEKAIRASFRTQL